MLVLGFSENLNAILRKLVLAEDFVSSKEVEYTLNNKSCCR